MSLVEAPPRTVGAALAAAGARLAATGTADPRREAVVLWAAVAGCAPGQVWLARGHAAPEEMAARFRAAVARRVVGEPLAYAAGTAAFRTLDIAVDRRVLIPRPETEGLVALVLDWAAAQVRVGERVPRALDVGTGSGAIALALAVEGPFALVVASDVSAGALAVAAQNLRRIAPRVPVRLVAGSLLEPFGAERFDVIVANPPYLTAAEHAALDPAVRGYEPGAALDGGPDGLGPTRTLLAGAARNLHHGGLLALELDCNRADAVCAEARAAGWRGARVVRDLWGRSRYFVASKGATWS